MANYSLPETGGLHKTITAGTTDRIDVPAGRAPKLIKVTVLNGWLFVRFDSTAAVENADGTYRVTENEPATGYLQPGAYISLVGPSATGFKVMYSVVAVAGG